MRIIVVLFCLGCSLWGQELKPVEIDFCDAWQRPEQYVGQMVRFQAELHYGRPLLLRKGGCGPINLAYPSGPDVNPKPYFTLIKNEAYNKVMESLPVLLIDHETGKRGIILATLEGRFDSVFSLNKKGKVIRKGKGFGHLSLYDNRLVLRSFEDVCVIGTTGNNDCTPLEK